jgi:hypothetical protein
MRPALPALPWSREWTRRDRLNRPNARTAPEAHVPADLVAAVVTEQRAVRAMESGTATAPEVAFVGSISCEAFTARMWRAR